MLDQKLLCAIAGLCLSCLLVQPVRSTQAPTLTPATASVTAPSVELTALAFPPGQNVKLKLAPSDRAPGLMAEATVSHRQGVTSVQLAVKNLRPAIDFGGEINTYVVWAIAPEGFCEALGELTVGGGKGSFQATTRLSTFALVVTAEPHFLVQRPSQWIIAQTTANSLAPDRGRMIGRFPFTFSEFETAYQVQQQALAPARQYPPELDTSRFQAIVAVRLAERADAAQYAPQELAKARDALQAAQKAFAEGAGPAQVRSLARRAIRLAVNAAQLAQRRKQEQELAAERRSNRELIEKLQQQVTELQRELLQTQQQAEAAQKRAARLEEDLQRAQAQLLQVNKEADELAQRLARAQQEARAAKNEAAELFARLQSALNRVAQTQETARGLMVNLPDILFDPGKATLKPESREVLSRIAGILMVAPEYRLSVEGHTDNTGRPELNMKLSIQRAQAVADYLVKAGVSPALITVRGFGETRPVASNRTAEGRARNRRVEIIVEGLAR